MYYVGARFTTAQFLVREKLSEGKERVKRFMEEEVGGPEIIATILILVVVIALGLVFKDNIIQVANNIWSKVGGGGGAGGESITSGGKDVTDPFN